MLEKVDIIFTTFYQQGNQDSEIKQLAQCDSCISGKGPGNQSVGLQNPTFVYKGVKAKNDRYCVCGSHCRQSHIGVRRNLGRSYGRSPFA